MSENLYNYERCYNNTKNIENINNKIENIMLDIHKIDLLNQKLADSYSNLEKEITERKIGNRWTIGLLITAILGITSLLIAVWGKF